MQPETIGRYKIKSELGRGGMAIVYLGYDPLFDREVAIKILLPELVSVSDSQFLIRFEREARIIASLEHPAIVPVYDIGKENGQHYFVMRYMRGGTLADKIKENVFTLEKAVKILEQIAPGIDEAHAKGIIHRDIKPNNILFDNRGNPTISDFGIAKLMKTRTTNTTVGAIGTPSYMSPEQAREEKIDIRTDIYALGIVFYEILTGKRPHTFIGGTVTPIHTYEPDLPKWVDTVISIAISEDRNDRFSSAAEMVSLIKEFQVGKKENVPPKNKLKYTIPTIISLIVIFAVVGLFLLKTVPQNTTRTETIAPDLILTSTQPQLATAITHAVPGIAVTVTSQPVETDTLIPSIPVIGGSDKIAFLNNNNIWIMNVDGSGLQSITNDRDEKLNIEWLPDGKTILYITGKTVKTVNIETQKVDVITSFSASDYFESFHVSPDGKQVAISLARQLHVVPFDLGTFKTITQKDDLLAMNGCIFYNFAEVEDAIWSNDGQKLTIKFAALVNQRMADTLRIIDIHLCRSSKPLRIDEFPALRFDFSDTIVNFDWDGKDLFYINNNKRNHGFGHLGIYNTRIFSFQEVAPIENICCYRDATFSPDGTHTIFAFQDIRLGSEGQIVLYYVPNEDMTKIGTLDPIPLPFGFFTEHDDAPMPIFRPVKN